MFNLSFRNRISIYYLISTAVITLAVFFVIYKVVAASAIYDVNEDLRIEVERHQEDVAKLQGTEGLVKAGEWDESEHTDIQINPIFVQIHDAEGRFLEKSPNLKNKFLEFFDAKEEGIFHDRLLGEIHIRQTQTPLYKEGRKVGYAIIAMSTEAPNLVVENLEFVLYIAFPIVLLVLFLTTRFLAGRSIKPALNIISTTSRITNNSFDERIVLPRNKDELYELSESINNLLDRIESAILREKQFTSDASHELRTPLAVIKGTLEVLIRKPRDKAEYVEKIAFCINEVNRLNNLVDQLLLLARFENQKNTVEIREVALDELILESLQRFSNEIESKGLTINFAFEERFSVQSDAWLSGIIIENILSNAIKYSRAAGVIKIDLAKKDESVVCSISDEGIGIPEGELNRVYEQFYRSRAGEHPEIKGTGLGLSLVKRLCDLLGITVNIRSAIDVGTTVILTFTQH